MELIERDGFLELLRSRFKTIAEGEGHCVFVTGEAGIGKTSLTKAFCKEIKDECLVYHGACDALFTPRPLAPLYDILWQVNKNLWPASHNIEERTELFTAFFRELTTQKGKIVIVFEDIHWADEATLDFIKFFARRITQLPCLFILTYRDDESPFFSSMRNIIAQLPADTFTRLHLTPLSREAVTNMASKKGYNGEDVYTISGGNPFYVTEILASYSPGVPENIKDAILAIYDRQDEGTRNAWQICSVIPEGLEINRFAKIKSSSDSGLDHCFALKIIIVKNNRVIFKHELYRRTIEASLSPFKRIALNKKMLDLFLDSFEKEGEVERIVQYAKNANENKLVTKYAPLAARKAACVGSHIEAARLFFTAIEYSEGNDEDQLADLYEAYAYECYLTNDVKEAIIYTGKLLAILKHRVDIERTGNCLRFLSRLWWLNGHRENAEAFARQAMDLLNNEPSSSAKAMAFSNMSQLKMLFDQFAECMVWGEKAITIARELGDEEALSHALNNVGSVQMNLQPSKKKGVALLQESLAIALKNSFHEHAARAYSNLGSNGVKMKDYAFAGKILDEGIRYCEERDLDSWRLNMLSLKAHLNLETGHWDKAYSIADGLLNNEEKPRAFKIGALIVIGSIKMRRGDDDALPILLQAKTRAFETKELQRIIPSLTALLEYEWLTGSMIIEREKLDQITGTIEQSIDAVIKSEFAFWLWKARKEYLDLKELFEGYELYSVTKAQNAVALWERSGNPYAQAIALFEGNETDKRKAVAIAQKLGATAINERFKLEMRTSGIKSIPRGIRKTTQSNPAFLTNREMDTLQLLKQGLQNKEIASRLFISAKTVDHHISSILFKLDVNSRVKAVNEAVRQKILK
jgi:predicted ATPase/DNA-binding CsgD family transcriptional regulator